MSRFGDEATRGKINRRPLFDGQHFEYQKRRLISFFISQNPKHWDLVETGYTAPTNEDGTIVSKKEMNVDQKNNLKMHHNAITFHDEYNHIQVV